MSGSASSPPAVAAGHREGHLTGTGGVRLYWQAWLPDGDPRAVVLIAHGGAEHGGRYRYFVERAVPEGFAVYAVDHRGHGRSEGPRAYVDRLDHVVADLDRLVDLATAEHPGRPVFLLGHSMGGCVAISYALRRSARLAGLVISAPVAIIEGSALQRLAVRLLSALAPRAGVHRVDSRGISRDPAEVEAYDGDPLVHRGKLPARTVAELVAATDSFPRVLPELELPLLVVQGTADRVVPVASGPLVHERAGSTDKTLRTYEGYYHELFNEPAGKRDRPLGDVLAWLRDRTPA